MSEWSDYVGDSGGSSGVVDGSRLFGQTMGLVALTAGTLRCPVPSGPLTLLWPGDLSSSSLRSAA